MSEKAEYDDIVDAHDEWRVKTNKIWVHEVENVHRTLAPVIVGARVLELAAGSGFYTFDFMDLGAASVLAVDISSQMLEAAKKLPQAEVYGDKVTFLHADASQGQVFDGAPFDVVFAAYLLPHAPDKATMVSMYKTVAANLKDGGTFVAVVSPVSEDPKEYFDLERKAMADFGLHVSRHFFGDIDDGITYQIKIRNQHGQEQFFQGYRLRKSVYEEAAKLAGFTKAVNWVDLQTPAVLAAAEDPSSVDAAIRKQVATPDFGILTVTK